MTNSYLINSLILICKDFYTGLAPVSWTPRKGAIMCWEVSQLTLHTCEVALPEGDPLSHTIS